MNSLLIERVLVFIDFTETSLNALAVAISFCRQHQTALHLLGVLPPETVGLDPATNSGSALMDHHLIREGETMIQMLAQVTAQEQGILCSGSYQTGLVHEEVSRIARGLNAELIIMGTRVGSGFQAYRTNNDAYQVIKSAPCPVLTVPDNYQGATFHRILFPVRPIPNAIDKYDFARKIIRRDSVELTVLALTVPDEVVSINQLEDALTDLDKRLTQDKVKSQIVFCQRIRWLKRS
ncbi:hypothetical protein GCM10027341_56240 [Spirosoma knui]